jgi:hypothetical protein
MVNVRISFHRFGIFPKVYIDDLLEPKKKIDDIKIASSFPMRQETDFGMSGIMKFGSVYFMVIFSIWRAVINLFL